MNYQNSRNVPDRLQKILNILEEYHRKLVQTNTSLSQDPSPSHAYVKGLLRQKGQILSNWLKTRNLLSDTSSPELNSVLSNLAVALEPWDSTVSTLTQSYIDSLFFECPLTLTVEHCGRLRKQAEEYGTVIDGEQYNQTSGMSTWNDQT